MNLPPRHRALHSGRVSLPNHGYLVTTTTRDRRPRFIDHDVARVASRTLCRVVDESGFDALAWVLMPDQLQVLGVLESAQSLAAGIARIKAAIEREVNRHCGTSGDVWAHAFEDHALRSEDSLIAAARCIIAHPVRAGLARSVQDYPYWNTVWLPS